MALPYPLPRQSRQSDIFNGDGRTTYGPFQFAIFDKQDVVALVARGSSEFVVEGVSVLLQDSAAFEKFTVTFAAPLTSADRARIVSRRLHERSVAVTRGSAIDSKALELELSKQGSVLQELRRDVDAGLGNGAGGGIPEAPTDGWTYGRTGRTKVWNRVVQIPSVAPPAGSARGISLLNGDPDFPLVPLEAPKDGKQYVRKDGAWEQVLASDGGSASVKNVRSYGAKGDDATNDTVAFQAAINALAAVGGGVLYVPAGTYKVMSDLTVATGVYFRGDTSILSNVKLYSNARILCNGDGPFAYGARKFSFRHIGIRTVGIHSSSPVTVSYVGGTGSTAVSLDIDDLEITGADYQSGWTVAGLDLFNVRNSRMRNMRIMGDTDGGTLSSRYGIRISGDGNPVELYVTESTFYFLREHIKIEGNTEGVYLRTCAFVAGTLAVKWDGNPKGKPLFSMMGCHANTGGLAVDLRSVSQFDISHNLFYGDHDGGQGKAAEYIGVRVDMQADNVDQTSRIQDNTFMGILTGIPKNGIVVGPGTGIETILIDGNIFKSFDAGILLQAGSNGVRVSPSNFYRDVTNPVVNQGTDNEVVTSWGGGSAVGGDTETVKPKANNTYSIGTTSLRYTTAWFTGEVTAGSFYSTGTINGAKLATAGDVEASGGVTAAGQVRGGSMYTTGTLGVVGRADFSALVNTAGDFQGKAIFLSDSVIVNGSKVVGARMANFADAGANPTVGDCADRITRIINVLRGHGLIG